MTTIQKKVLDEVVSITMKPCGIAEHYFRRDWDWIQKELNIQSSRVFKGVYILFELRFTNISDLMAGLDWLQEYFDGLRTTLYYEKEVYPHVRWTKRRGY